MKKPKRRTKRASGPITCSYYEPDGCPFVFADGIWFDGDQYWPVITSWRKDSMDDAFCAIVGYSREELEGMRFESITHPDDVGSDRRFAEASRLTQPDGPLRAVAEEAAVRARAEDIVIRVTESIRHGRMRAGAEVWWMDR